MLHEQCCLHGLRNNCCCITTQLCDVTDAADVDCRSSLTASELSANSSIHKLLCKHAQCPPNMHICYTERCSKTLGVCLNVIICYKQPRTSGAEAPQRLPEPLFVSAGEGGVEGAPVLPESLFKRALTSDLATRSLSAAPANSPGRNLRLVMSVCRPDTVH